jgi:hypothetical protein
MHNKLIPIPPIIKIIKIRGNESRPTKNRGTETLLIMPMLGEINPPTKAKVRIPSPSKGRTKTSTPINLALLVVSMCVNE